MTTLIPHRLRLVAVPALALMTSAFGRIEDGAVDVIKQTVDKVTTILGDEGLGYLAKRQQVDEILRLRVDEQVVARLVLARNWKKFEKAQQDSFVRAFMDHMVLTYWDNLESAKIAKVTVTSDREEQRGDWTVKTKVDLGPDKDPVLIDYRLRREGSEGESARPWRIIDIIVEGVSMVSNFRAQFQEVFSNGGAQHLIDAILKKNETLNARLEKEHSR